MDFLAARLTKPEADIIQHVLKLGLDHYFDTCPDCVKSDNAEGCDKHSKPIHLLRRLRPRFTFGGAR